MADCRASSDTAAIGSASEIVGVVPCRREVPGEPQIVEGGVCRRRAGVCDRPPVAPSVLTQTFWPKNTPKLPMTKQWLAIKAKLPAYSPPRTPDGVPDFPGVWGGAGGDGMPNVEGSDIMLDDTTAAQESGILDPPDQNVPYLPWARAKFQEHLKGIGRGWPWKMNFPKRRAGSGPVGGPRPPTVPGAMAGLPSVDRHPRCRVRVVQGARPPK